MPAKIRKLRNQNYWEVIDSKGHTHAKKTTKKKAQTQVRILNGL